MSHQEPNITYTIVITDPNLTLVGDPIVVFSSLDVTLRFNEPGSGFFTTPAYPWIVEQLAPGNRVSINRDGQQLISGPIEGWLHEQSDDGENAGVGSLNVNFADDLAKIVARDVYPNPALEPDGQLTDFWTFSGNAELALRDLVNLNAGPGALVARRVPALVLGPLASVGSSVAVTVPRQQPLGNVAREIALTGGTLGFRTAQVGSTIEFQVFAPQDKSAEVRFGFGLGNLKYRSFETKAPTATAVTVGGQGEGSDAFMIERLNAGEIATWGRFEQHVARAGSADLQELQDDGDRALAEGAATIRLAANVSDTPDQRFGTHYTVGDIAAVEAWPGTSVTDIIRSVHIQVTAGSGEYIAATVGSQAATTDPVWAQRLQQIDERLGRLERVATPIT